MKHLIINYCYSTTLFSLLAYTSWIPKWEKSNKWKTTNNKDVENKGLFQRLMKLTRARNAEVTIVRPISMNFFSCLLF